MKIRLSIAAIVFYANAVQVQAHQPSFNECLEASEFVLHAAMSRDGGISREAFVGRVQSDLVAIQNFPPEVRWFAQDEDDERFLLGASEGVFDTPRTPQVHQAEFMDACVDRMGTESTRFLPDPEVPVPQARIERESRL